MRFKIMVIISIINVVDPIAVQMLWVISKPNLKQSKPTLFLKKNFMELLKKILKKSLLCPRKIPMIPVPMVVVSPRMMVSKRCNITILFWDEQYCVSLHRFSVSYSLCGAFGVRDHLYYNEGVRTERKGFAQQLSTSDNELMNDVDRSRRSKATTSSTCIS